MRRYPLWCFNNSIYGRTACLVKGLSVTVFDLKKLALDWNVFVALENLYGN